jgi:hypothetical protein
MSFDPYGADVPDYSANPPPPDDAAVRERVQMPAVFLIIVGALNLFGGGYCLLNGLVALRMPVEEFQRQMARQNPQAIKQMEQMGWSPEGVLAAIAYGFIGVGAVGALLALLTILGGVRMMQLRSYGLVVFVSILTMLPGISTSACCCLGEGVGLWALIVLLNGEVRSAFR